MTIPSHQLPEPLQAFDGLADSVASSLGSVDVAFAEYRRLRDAGRVLPNSVEAMRVELTYHSNAIEGSTLTLRETQLVIEGHAPTSGKSLREVYEARNHDRALRAIELAIETDSEHSQGASPPQFREKDVLDVHADMLADIDPHSAGRLRTDRVLIRGTRYVPPGSHRFDELIPATLASANRPGVHAVLQAAELHYNLVAVHPFNDGNGRTARLMMNWQLLRHGYPHTIIEVERRGEYLAALEEANAGRCDPFARFVIECVVHSIRRLIGDGDQG